jgi:hypothetical protein
MTMTRDAVVRHASEIAATALRDAAMRTFDISVRIGGWDPDDIQAVKDHLRSLADDITNSTQAAA